ncbi:FKBP-type peptidyl-prolyl cis-trans isomerase [Mobilicoccus caccae]|uniref:peptidylprolyl isomerase n=1 Tax=Mobilicoccus caccae TaxID=1859295 RepID=A0ABQ6INT0_9MICO|nr:FKBP-type peptidyl-prolyl cis-trans isomerase [Mobilicoccus caccae]GMA39578.1 peptidylprolyl isomerase [Mobilicoccus caccae]
MSSFRLRLAAAVLPFTLVLAACGNDAQNADAPPPTTAAAAAESQELAPVKVEGAPGAKPTITLPSTPFMVSGPGHRTVAAGDGKDITEADTVSAHFLLLNAKDGKELESRFGEEVVGLGLGDETLQPAIRNALVGQKVGARVLVAVPAKEAVGEQGNPTMGIAAADTLLYFFEVTDAKTPLKEATGTPVPPKAGLPTVQMGASPQEPAKITVPKGAPPKETVVQPLIQGKGPKVQAGQTVRVSYTGVTWRDPANPFDYSGKTPEGYAEFPIGQGGLIKAWDENIPGQTVGSRILMVVPPADGYGKEGRGEQIKGDDTMIFVLDILDAT